MVDVVRYWGTGIICLLAVAYTAYWVRTRFIHADQRQLNVVPLIVALGLGAIVFGTLWPVQPRPPARELVKRKLPLRAGTVLQGSFHATMTGPHSLTWTTIAPESVDIEWRITQNNKRLISEGSSSGADDFHCEAGQQYDYWIQVRKTDPAWQARVSPTVEIGFESIEYGYVLLGWEIEQLFGRGLALSIACLLYCWALARLVRPVPSTSSLPAQTAPTRSSTSCLPMP